MRPNQNETTQLPSTIELAELWHPIMLRTPEHKSDVWGWHGHLPFAMWCIAMLEPKVFVELGTHKGDSYLAFCQSVRELSVRTRCVAVDTWQGDAHAGGYEEDVYETLRHIHDSRFGDFSTLLRKTFDEARADFEDGSIDLLHIDGLHTYEAVKHDFESWLPKLSPRGVVLFHDIAVHEHDFGVFRLWEEVSAQYPHFSFEHSFGLGLIVVGNAAPSAASRLCNLDPQSAAEIRDLFARLGAAASLGTSLDIAKRQLQESDAKIVNLEARVLAYETELALPGVKFGRWIAHLRDRFAPEGTRRRQLTRLIVRSIRIIQQEGFREFLRKVARRVLVWLTRFGRLLGILRSAPLRFDKAFYMSWFPEIALRPQDALADFKERFLNGNSAELTEADCSKLLGEIVQLAVDPENKQDADVSEPPDASIIIPVYGKLGFTLRCLRSIYTNGSSYRFEIVVVDDASPDHSADRLSQIPGLRLVRHEKNLGFISSCNDGATAARGRYLVFLNNDTITLDHWLDELLDVFTAQPDAGLVGAQLIYPHGRLQEAGGIVWRDGSAWNYGNGQDRNRPEFNYLRDVDYCSGAVNAISGKLFKELGGFDTEFSPAYYEDVDLAMKVRNVGLRVLYQPMSRVVHFEGITSGTDTASGVKSYQLVNHEKFYRRWHTKLIDHRPHGDAPHLECERRVDRRALFLDATVITPDRDGGSMVADNWIRIIQSLGFKVSFAAPGQFQNVGEPTKRLQRRGVECLYAPYYDSLIRYLRMHGKHLDVCVIFRYSVANSVLSAIRRFAPQAKVIFHVVDLHFLRSERQAKLFRLTPFSAESAAIKSKELEICARADLVATLSEVERQVILQERPEAKVWVSPPIHDVCKAVNGFESRRDLCYVGGYNHVPNQDAVRFFARIVFPLVLRKIPGIHFNIIGSDPPPDFSSLITENIRLLGHVPDLSPLLSRMRVFVAPIRWGAGVKTKISMSLSHGLPVVGTTVAFEGMNLVDGKDVLIADSPEEMCEQIVRAYSESDLWKTLSQNGLLLASKEYSFDANRRILAGMFREVGVSTKIIEEMGAEPNGPLKIGRAVPTASHADSRSGP
jgi:GT2 family glycosyltransferase